MSGRWSSAKIHAELRDILSIREASNRAFRSGDYALSTGKYSEANYDILWLKASLLKHTTFSEVDNDGKKVSHFRKALNCTSMAEQALKDHPTQWKPSENAKRKLLYRRAQAYEGLEDYDGAWEAIQVAHNLLAEKDEAICGLAMNIWKVRQYGKDAAQGRFAPMEPDFFFKPYQKENYDRLERCRLCEP